MLAQADEITIIRIPYGPQIMPAATAKTEQGSKKIAKSIFKIKKVIRVKATLYPNQPAAVWTK